MKKHYFIPLILALSLFCALPISADDVEFDVVSGSSASYSGTHNVTLKGRTFTAGQWTGLCLPFDASATVLSETFGADGYNIQEYASKDGTTLKFKKVTEVKAGTPYFIKVTTTVENPKFSNVTFASSINDTWNAVNIADNLVLRGFYFQKYAYQLYDSNNDNEYLWLNAVGTLSYKNEGTYVNERPGVNAYFFLANTTSSATKPTISFEGATTDGGDNGSGDNGDGDNTDTSSLAYKIAHKQQLTDVPTIYLTIPECGSSENDLDTYLYKNSGKGQKADDAPYRNARMLIRDNGTDKSSFHFTDMTTDTLLIKVRGNSTANPQASTKGGKRKKAYRIKFDKKLGASKHDMIGNGVKTRNWTLLANVCDNSLMRNAITYHLNKELGMDFCPGYKFVDLVINGNYRGTYQISDHVKAEEGRVNVNEDTGWVVEFQGRQDMCDYPMMFSESGLMMNVKNPEPDDENDETQRNAVINPIKTWFTSTWAKKWKDTDAYSRDGGWRSVNDETSLMNFWISTEFTGDYDGWMTVKAYKEADESAKLFWGPIWDKDLAYGNYTGESSGVLVANASGNGSSVTAYLKESLNTDPYFTAAAKAKIDSLIQSGLITRLQNKCDELAKLLEQTQALNFEYYDINGSSPLSIDTHKYDTYQGYVDALKTYLETRIKKVQSLTEDINKTANKKLSSAVTYDPTKDTYNSDFNNWDWSNNRNMNKLTDVSETNRTYKAGKWNTFCVPFDLTMEQAKTIFGSGLEVVEHTGMASDATTMVFRTVTGSYLKAGYPYLLKFTGQDISNPTFTNVIITETASTTNGVTYNGHGVTYDDRHYFYGTLFTASVLNTSTDYTFTDDVYDNYSTSLSKATSTSIAGARAYLRIPSDETSAVISINPNEENTTTRKQLTSLPTIYIDGTATDSWSRAAMQVFDKDNKLASIGTDNTILSTDEATGVQFQFQGSGTEGSKNSYRLKFDKKVKLVPGSADKYKQWVLASNDDDPTMARNALAWDMSKAIGLEFTPAYQFVDLYINNVYMGTYQLCDRVKAESGRALVKDGNKDSDWLVQLADNGEVKEEDDNYIAAAGSAPNIIPKNPDKDDLTEEQYTTLTATMKEWFQGTLFKDIKSFSDNVDQDQFINWYIAQELLCTYKGLSSIDLYRSVTATDQKAHFGPIWDSEKSFGNNDPSNKKHAIDMSDKDTDGSYDGLITEYADYKVMRRVLKNIWLTDWFADGVLKKWQTLYGDLKTTDLLATMKTSVNTIKATIDASATLNYKAAAEGGAGWSLKYDTPYETAYTNLTKYLEDRFAYLDAKFKALAQSKTLVYNTGKDDALDAWTMTNGQSVKVQLKKRGTINGGEWNMLTLPFSLNSSEIDTYFGNGTQVEQFTSASETGNVVTLRFTDCKSSGIEAGKPYIVKPTSDVAEKSLVFGDRTFSTTESDLTVENGGYKHIGTLNSTTLPNDGTALVLLHGNSLKRYTGTTALNGCRAYFLVPTNSNAKTFSFMDETTGIELLRTEADKTGADRVFNLSGQQVGTSLDQLPSGVYIVRGKKMVK